MQIESADYRTNGLIYWATVAAEAKFARKQRIDDARRAPTVESRRAWVAIARMHHSRRLVAIQSIKHWAAL